MMCTQDTVLDVLGLFRGVGLSKVPDNEDAHQWLRVLNDVPAVLFEMAAEHYLKTPIEVKGHLRGVRYCPTAAELRSIAFALESTQRHEVKKSRRGCARCGELIGDDGAITHHGNGYRTITQHCHPVDDDGLVQWHEPPYRIASRQVLCNCELGRYIAHQHATLDTSTLPKHIAGQWRPTLTVEQAFEVFQRDDAKLYATGTKHRAHDHDTRPGSPWFAKPSPEEEWGKGEKASNARAVAYQVIRGEIDPRQVIKQKLAKMGR